MEGIFGAVSTEPSDFVQDMIECLQRRPRQTAETVRIGAAHLGVVRGKHHGCHARIGRRRPWCFAIDGELREGWPIEDGLPLSDVMSQSLRSAKGGFALAVASERDLVLARDWFGRRSLFYTLLRNGRLFVFASDLKTLLACDAVPTDIDLATLTDLGVQGHPVGNATMLRNVQSVQPGHLIAVSTVGDRLELTDRCFAGPREQQMCGYSETDVLDRMEALLRDSLTRASRSAERVGVALSGGIDSAVLGLLAAETCRPVAAVTVAPSRKSPELSVAAGIAQLMGVRHEIVTLDFDQYLDAIPKSIYALESLMRRTRLVTMQCLTSTVAQFSDACLTGFGATEVFVEDSNRLDWEEARRLRRDLLSAAIEKGLPVREALEAFLETAAEPKSWQEHVEHLDWRIREWSVIRSCEAHGRAAGVDMLMPYYDDDFVNFTRSVPSQLKWDPNMRIPKYLLKAFAIRLYGYSIARSILREKSPLFAGTLGFARQFSELCSLLPDEYARRHSFREFFSQKEMLLQLDIFQWLFSTNRGASAEIDVREFLHDRGAPATALKTMPPTGGSYAQGA